VAVGGRGQEAAGKEVRENHNKIHRRVRRERGDRKKVENPSEEAVLAVVDHDYT
jgi:hypothetical protein